MSRDTLLARRRAGSAERMTDAKIAAFRKVQRLMQEAPDLRHRMEKNRWWAEAQTALATLEAALAATPPVGGPTREQIEVLPAYDLWANGGMKHGTTWIRRDSTLALFPSRPTPETKS